MNVPASVGGQDWYLVHAARAAQLVRLRDEGVGYFAEVLAEAVYQPMMLVRRKVMRRHLTPEKRKAGHDFYREVKVPLLPRYLLVRFNLLPEGVAAALGLEGLACEGGRPYVASQALIERIRKMEHDGCIPGSTPLSAFVVGETVRITAGPFWGWNATIAELDESSRVRVLLSLFGRESLVELDIDQLEKL